MFYHNKMYTCKKGGSTAVYWQCERRRDMNCKVVQTSDTDGQIVKAPTVAQSHGVSAMVVWLTVSSRRLEAASAAILNEFVTLELALSLGSEPAIQSNGLAHTTRCTSHIGPICRTSIILQLY